MIEAELPDGTILEFPDNTPPDVVQRAVKSRLNVAVPQAAPKEQPSFGEMLKREVVGSVPVQAAMGALRGAGSIGATLLSPIDAAARAMGVQNQFIGRNDRREAMTSALQDMGADPSSAGFQAGKVGAEVAGTLGVGGALGKAASAIPGVASKAPMLINALQSGGMNLGGTTGKAALDMALRMGAGAATGGAAAGLINPEDARTGAVIGAAMPPAIQGAAAAGQAVGKKAAEKYAEAVSKFSREAPMRQTLKEAVGAGYVVPPNMVNPSAKNAIIESFSGKQATSQLASVRNQQVTEKLVRESLGLADDAPLTKGALEQIRKVQGGAYQQVGSLSPQAKIDLEALKQARNDAQGWFNAYNRSASPADLTKAKDFRDLAEKLELQLEAHAQAAGKPDLIPALRDARKAIAKTYTVERALNDASGTVNAKVLGRLYEKGKPLSDGMETVGKFASAFPSVAQAPQQMGSPAAHNLRSMASLLMGGGGAAAAGPVGLAAAALPFAAGPASRALMFREGAQKALANQVAPTMGRAAELAQLLQNPELQLLLARSAPAISAQGR